MVDWQALEGIGGVATAAAVVLAVVFGVAQQREAARQRMQSAAMATVSSWLDASFVASLDRVLRLPDDADPRLVDEDDELRRAVMQVDFSVEGVGVLVFERSIDLHAADLWMGGVVRAGWRKVRRWVEAERARMGAPALAEWWQWLVERMEEDPAPGKAEGAHVAFRAWRA